SLFTATIDPQSRHSFPTRRSSDLAASFRGYRRADGRVGTRNHVLVVPTVVCASVVAERIAAAVAPVGTALPHLAGCGQLGPDLRSEEHTSELQSPYDLVCRLLLEN